MRKNVLVQYQGGGYDGCIWEWNYFYIDKQGTFHNIQASGCGGIETLEAAQKLIEQDKDSVYIYDISNEQDITAFSKETHAVHVSGVLQWFGDYNANKAESFIDFFAVCSACGYQISDPYDLMVEGTEILCSECFSLGECPCCESYVGVDEMVGVDPDEHHDHSYICSECKEYHDGEREAESLEDLRWQSFCTGEPDMFSGELRLARL